MVIDRDTTKMMQKPCEGISRAIGGSEWTVLGCRARFVNLRRSGRRIYGRVNAVTGGGREVEMPHSVQGVWYSPAWVKRYETVGKNWMVNPGCRGRMYGKTSSVHEQFTDKMAFEVVLRNTDSKNIYISEKKIYNKYIFSYIYVK